MPCPCNLSFASRFPWDRFNFRLACINSATRKHEFSATRGSGPFALVTWDSVLGMVNVMAKSNFKIVLVTAPDLKTARRLARAALEAQLIACANLLPGIESHYRWKGRVERSIEVLLVLKTAQTRLAALERLVLAKHPYDTPEFVVLNPAGGTKRYLHWWAKCLQVDRK